MKQRASCAGNSASGPSGLAPPRRRALRRAQRPTRRGRPSTLTTSRKNPTHPHPCLAAVLQSSGFVRPALLAVRGGMASSPERAGGGDGLARGGVGAPAGRSWQRRRRRRLRQPRARDGGSGGGGGGGGPARASRRRGRQRRRRHRALLGCIGGDAGVCARRSLRAFRGCVVCPCDHRKAAALTVVL